MEDLVVAFKITGVGLAIVFAVMTGISVAIWLMGRSFAFFETLAARRSLAPKPTTPQHRQVLEGSIQ